MLKILISVVMLACFCAVGAMAQTAPNAQQTEAYRNKPCSDPWINFVYATEYKRSPVGQGNSVGECNITFYKDGKWNSYLELRQAIIDFQSEAVKFKLISSNNQFNVALITGNELYKVNIISPDKAKLISNNTAILPNNGDNAISENKGGIIYNNGGGILSNANAGIDVVPSTNKSLLAAGRKTLILKRSGVRIIIR